MIIAILLIICVGQSSCTEVGKKGDWLFQSEDKWDTQWRAGQVRENGGHKTQ